MSEAEWLKINRSIWWRHPVAVAAFTAVAGLGVFEVHSYLSSRKDWSPPSKETLTAAQVKQYLDTKKEVDEYAGKPDASFVEYMQDDAFKKRYQQRFGFYQAVQKILKENPGYLKLSDGTALRSEAGQLHASSDAAVIYPDHTAAWFYRGQETTWDHLREMNRKKKYGDDSTRVSNAFGSASVYTDSLVLAGLSPQLAQFLDSTAKADHARVVEGRRLQKKSQAGEAFTPEEEKYLQDEMDRRERIKNTLNGIWKARHQNQKK
jgi:hypothetical protein